MRLAWRGDSQGSACVIEPHDQGYVLGLWSLDRLGRLGVLGARDCGKGKASKRRSGKFTSVKSVWICQQYDWCIDYWKVHRNMCKGIYVGSAQGSES